MPKKPVTMDPDLEKLSSLAIFEGYLVFGKNFDPILATFSRLNMSKFAPWPKGIC